MSLFACETTEKNTLTLKTPKIQKPDKPLFEIVEVSDGMYENTKDAYSISIPQGWEIEIENWSSKTLSCVNFISPELKAHNEVQIQYFAFTSDFKICKVQGTMEPPYDVILTQETISVNGIESQKFVLENVLMSYGLIEVPLTEEYFYITYNLNSDWVAKESFLDILATLSIRK